MIEARYGKKDLQSCDCPALAEAIGVSETTLKRMLGLVGKDSPERRRIPHRSTMDILSHWLGYTNYSDLLKFLNQEDSASEFADVESIETSGLHSGDIVEISYDPERRVRMRYEGAGILRIEEAVNSKLLPGDRIKIPYLVLGLELIAKEVWRGEKCLGAYRAAKDGGITSIEVKEAN